MSDGKPVEYQLEVRLTINKLDQYGNPDYRDRFEVTDQQKLGHLPVPKLLEIMGNIHTAITEIGIIANRQTTES